ncbi:hypothetical protein [Candidatus Nitrotoga sp. M5]|uniref:hypothetical protein n=1 Tax=Candidatus Nitrotoga sp. M5 TaxID=2890409 RepID=UPI001EF2FF08|nr:hypothetical protein [Candidatus Nitrotoga sp. M5]
MSSANNILPMFMTAFGIMPEPNSAVQIEDTLITVAFCVNHGCQQLASQLTGQ